MKSIILFIITITVSFDVHSAQKNDKFLGLSTQLLAADIFPKLGGGNQLVSPFVIQSGLTLLPATKKARDELVKALHTFDSNTWTNLYRKFLNNNNHLQNIEINIGTGLYVSNRVQFLKAYFDLLQKYGTELSRVDFSQPQKVADEINKWVEIKTNNKITNIVDPATLNSDTEALLVTALYFNGEWQNKFDEGSTHKRKFYSQGLEKEADMMMQTDTFNYAENAELDAKFLELPYLNNDFTMTIVLPNKNDGLPLLEKQIDKIFAPQDMSYFQTNVVMPKFKFENKVQLTDILKKLGITHIFNDGISFGRKKLGVDRVLQKSFVEVNERGTEAAVVMEIEMSNRFGFTEINSFVANHPFLFFIQQKSSGVVLFLGRYNDPDQTI